MVDCMFLNVIFIYDFRHVANYADLIFCDFSKQIGQLKGTDMSTLLFLPGSFYY